MKVYARPVFLLAILCIADMLPAAGFAQNIIHVPADAPTIQSAVFAAQNGDTVLVSPGLYFGTIDFTGKNITVMSSDGAAVTTVDGGLQPAARFANNENHGAILKGFTFVNGAGIQVFSASPIIEDNVITGNQGCQAGGISLSQSSAIVQRNTITNNVQFCVGGPAGGGIEIDGSGSVQILNNTISGNQMAPGGLGAGVFTVAFGTTTISGNKIQNNVTDGSGGGIYANGNLVIIVDNLVTGNSAGTGGGILIFPGTNALVANNTVALNRAQQGPGLQFDGVSGKVDIFNNIFYDLTGNGAIFCSATGVGSVFFPAISNDAISFAGDPAGPSAPAYTGVCSDLTGFNGNVQVDPQFVNASAADFHLAPTSPLIDIGSNNIAQDLPPQDLDGNPRIAAGSIACIPSIDIGAYEFLYSNVGSAALTSSTVTFGTTFIGSGGSTQPLTMTGTQGCAQIASIATTGDYQQTSDCYALRPGATCTIQVAFVPHVPGIRSGTISVNLLSPAATLTATLSGVAQNSATASPTEVHFGVQPLRTSQFQALSITSNAGQPLVVSSIAITSSDFQQDNGCANFSSNTCFIAVEFTPTQAGPRSGILTVNTNLGVFTIPLDGDGAAPSANLTPASLSFPSQTLGTTSATQVVTLTNNGTADLFINSAVGTPDFQVSPLTCAIQLSPGASCTFSVVFTPTTIGPTTANVEIDTNAGPATISVTGIGTSPIATLNPQILNFATEPLNTVSAAHTITITNISGAPLQLISLTAPDNFLATSSCPAVLDVNASCGIDVVFAPSSSGPYGGFLSLGTTLGTVTATLSVGSHNILNVPSQFQTIFDAVQLAQDGDTILVAPGTYFEQVNFFGKAITIASTGGAEVTTLDGQGFRNPVFAFQNEGPGSVLRGFTITHAQGSAIQVFGASPTIENNIITDNSGCQGAGLQLQSSSAIIRHNTISNNTSNCFGDGGGIWIGGPGNVQVLNNLITGNQTSSPGAFGGGIAVSGATATISGNTIQNNSSTFGSGGGIAIINGGTANVIQNLITGNSASFGGGGIWVNLDSFPSPQLINNTIADNFAPNGSGLFVDGVNPGATFANNLVIDSSGNAAVACSFSTLSGSFRFNDVISLSGGTAYNPACGNQTSISGNISQDPQFVNPASGNYRLQPSSPAVDAGSNLPSSVFGFQLPDRDLDNNGRIGPGSAATCNGTIDLGAYEFTIGPSGTPGPLPPSLDFGNSTVGFTSAPFVFNLTAQGCVPVASIKTTGDFQQTNTCSGAVSSVNSCTISVSFDPQHLGPATGSLTVDFGAAAPAATVVLSGDGVGVPPFASPSSLNFGPQLVGTSSAAQQVFTFANLPTPFNVNAIWITGDFSQTNQCAALQPNTGGLCTINVVFTPTASGNGQGNLTVSTNQGVVVIPLTGQIDPGVTVSLSPTSLVFPGQLVGTISNLQTITLNNTGSTVASPLHFSTSGDFLANSQTCPVSTGLNPGQSCTISISFSPTTVGPRTGSLLVNAGSVNLTASLSGPGVAPQASVSPASLEFGNQLVQAPSAAQTVTLTNIGSAPLNVGNVLTGGDFAQTNNCLTVAPAASCLINVVFTPTGLGARTGTLSISSNSGTLKVVLSGRGVNASATTSPASLNFGSELLNIASQSQVVTLTAGINPLQITSISTSGDFNATNNCGASLAAADSCTIQVTLVATATGARTGTLTLISNEGTLTLPLAGNGLTRDPNTIYVPADQATIQAAIDAAAAGQNVSVLPGIYAEHIDFHGKAIIVASTDGPGFSTIDGSLSGTVVTFQTGEGSGSILQGFTITRGTSMFGGSGIQIASASPVVESNVITGNQGCGGIGINISIGSATIRNNTITNNVQTICSGGNGGGIGVGGGAPKILNNIITGNLLLLGGEGGGIFLNGSSALISGNRIQGNSVFNNGGGIAIINAENPVVVQNLVTGNSAGSNGGGIYWSVPSGSRGPFVVNNTVSNNSAGSGSAAFSEGFTGNVQISNNIFRGSDGSVALECSSLFTSTPPILSANDAFSRNGTGYGDACLGQLGSNGNISADPQFVNPAGDDYHLLGGSPVIDSGNNLAPSLPAKDLDGNPRIAFGSATTCANTVDLGAFEFVLTAEPAFGLTPASADFGVQALGTASAAQTFTVSTSQGCVVPPVISVSGDFSQTNNCQSVLPTGASCAIQVIFNPTAGGLRSGTLNASSSGSAASASLSGQGGIATAVLSPSALDFGDQAVQTSSAPRAVSLTNSGNIPMLISGISVTGNFAQSNSCPASLNPGTGCTLSVVFSPVALGGQTGTLVISSNAGAASVNLTGSGTARLLSASPASLIYTAQLVGTTGPPQAVTLTNNGNQPTTIASITTAGDFAQTNNCGTTLAAGTTCLVNVTFTPGARLLRTGSLTVQSNASTGTLTVGLSGTGIAPIAVLTNTLNFAPQVVGTASTQSAMLGNNGDAALNITSVVASGDFTQTNTCGTSLAPGSSCAIQVSFVPIVAGPRSGSVVVADSDPAGTSQTLALSGTGLDYAMSATPASLTVKAGQTASYTISVMALGGTFGNAVSLSCSGLPAGASCLFSPVSVTPGSSSASATLSLATSSGQHGTRKTPQGTYTIRLSGVSGSLTHSTTVQLAVQ